MRTMMTKAQRDTLVSEYLAEGTFRHENIIHIRVHSDGIVQVTSQQGLYTYHDAIERDGNIIFDRRLIDKAKGML